MIRNINLCGRIISYNFEYKNVKNINVRIKSDGSVNVSANRWIKKETVESFLVSKSDFILSAIDKYKNSNATELFKFFTEDELKELVFSLCRKAYPYYEKMGIPYPVVKFRRMVSMWGNCRPQKAVLTFNTNLVYAPSECVEYVVWHEFTHFLQSNHSEKFYKELEKVCPDWKEKRKKLKGIVLR